jgi:hypothetical protein
MSPTNQMSNDEIIKKQINYIKASKKMRGGGNNSLEGK